MAVTAVRAAVGAGAGLTSRAAAEAYIGGVCFKQGPPCLIGAELEWLTEYGECSAPAPRPDTAALAAALGSYAPPTISPESPALPLPGGSRITVEPGGQVELSSAPFSSAAELCASLRADVRHLERLLESRSIRTLSAAADGLRPPQRVLQSPRYRAMEQSFAGIGPFGKLMMCNTAATQVSVDAGADHAEIAARWTALNTIGPALLAAFACSPDLHEAPAGSWASQRMRAWLRLDHARTRPPVLDWPDPVTAYARWVLDVPLLCVRRSDHEGDWAAPPGATFADWLCGALDDEIDRRPDAADLDYHLTTMFPPVRAAGYLEVRYIDAQPGQDWAVPIHVIEALMSAPEVVAAATRAGEPVADRWLEAARCGLSDPEIRSAAVDLLEIAAAAAAPEAVDVVHAAARRARAGLMPTAR